MHQIYLDPTDGLRKTDPFAVRLEALKRLEKQTIFAEQRTYHKKKVVKKKPAETSKRNQNKLSTTTTTFKMFPTEIQSLRNYESHCAEIDVVKMEVTNKTSLMDSMKLKRQLQQQQRQRQQQREKQQQRQEQQLFIKVPAQYVHGKSFPLEVSEEANFSSSNRLIQSARFQPKVNSSQKRIIISASTLSKRQQHPQQQQQQPQQQQLKLISLEDEKVIRRKPRTYFEKSKDFSELRLEPIKSQRQRTNHISSDSTHISNETTEQREHLTNDKDNEINTSVIKTNNKQLAMSSDNQPSRYYMRFVLTK